VSLMIVYRYIRVFEFPHHPILIHVKYDKPSQVLPLSKN